MKDVEGIRRVLDEARVDGKRQRMVMVWRRRGRGCWKDLLMLAGSLMKVGVSGGLIELVRTDSVRLNSVAITPSFNLTTRTSFDTHNTVEGGTI